MAAFIVVASTLLAAAFTIAWLVDSDVRAWLERPKHRFLSRAREYDKKQEVAQPFRAANEQRFP
jgi:hypothetical protein